MPGDFTDDRLLQARLFYTRQTEVERNHIRDAFVFELSKCEMEAVRVRMVLHLLNIDEGLAQGVAERLAIEKMPKPAPVAQPALTGLDASPALSIVQNGPGNFKGRVVGAPVSDGADADMLAALSSTLEAEGAKMKVVAPGIGGITDSAGQKHPADEKIDGRPWVLFDAVAILPGAETATEVAALPGARDLLADAIAHSKFIDLGASADALVAASGLDGKLEAGCVRCDSDGVAKRFVEACADLRYWQRELP